MKPNETLADILANGTALEIRTIFNFDYTTETKEIIHKKFKLFTRAFFSRYLRESSAPFHEEMGKNLIASYMGQNFLNLAFRGSAKSTLAKLFLTFVILNDTKHYRKYIKVLSKDGKNPKQIVTDIYNMCVEVRDIYGDVFEKDNKDIKREERMDSFTMRSGVKVTASTVGQTQRGNVQDAYRPDYIILDDVEDSESVRSLAITESIILTIEEAFNGLAKNGSWTCLGNYISEDGVIQYLREKRNKIEMITPIANDLVITKGEFISCEPTWNIFSQDKIKELYYDTTNFYGEYMCLKPDTKVLTDKGFREISTLQIGDMVMTHKNRFKKIIQTFENEGEDLIDITINNTIISITKNHPVLTLKDDEEKWISAGELEEGDLLLKSPMVNY